MRFRLTILFVLAWLPMRGIGNSAASAQPPEASLRAINLLPDGNVLEGWTQPENPGTYFPKDVYKLVNGAAPLYHSYGVREVVRAEYVSAKDPAARITADIYDQGTLEGAFGVYSSGRRRDERFQNWGVQGYRSGSILAAWKDRFYIYISANDENSETAKALESLARKITARIPGENRYPASLRRLPEKNRIADSESYVAKDYLGYSFLTHAVSAMYRVETTTATLFVSEYSTREEAQSAYDQLSRELQDKRVRENIPSDLSKDCLVIQNQSLGRMIVTQTGTYVIGAFSQEESASWEQLQRILSPCIDALSPP